MENIEWLLRTFPGLAVGIAGVIGGAIAWLAGWRARRDIDKTHDKQLEALKELFKTQREIAEAQHDREREILNHQLEKLGNERQEYKEQLHAEKDSHNQTSLRLKEVEMRPDLSALQRQEDLNNQERREVYKEFSSTLKEIAATLRHHEGTVDERTKPILEGIKQLIDASVKQGGALATIMEMLQGGNGKKKKGTA